MKNLHRRALIQSAATAAVLAGLLGGSIAVEASIATRAAPSTAHGESFLFKTQLDSSFCVDVVSGATQGRTVFLSTCSTADTQRWSLTKNADGSNAFIDSQGMCVDSSGRKAGDGLPVKVFNCNFGKTQRFRYTAAGHIQVNGTNLCFSIPLAATGAAVSLAKCSNTSTRQVFKLAR